MDVLPYTAFDVLAMVMEGTHLPAPAAATTAPDAAAAKPVPTPETSAGPNFRQAA